MADKKFYWLKLNKDFFDRHEIKIIEGMPNGKEYVLFYIKLMCESVSHDGDLRFSENIPYTREMLAAVTNTRMEIVDGAMDLLQDLGLIEYEDDKTYFMTKVPGMTGSAAANDNAVRQRRHREKQKALKNEDCNADVTEERYASVTNDNESIEYRDKSIEFRDNKGYINSLDYGCSCSSSISTATTTDQIQELYPENIDEIVKLWNSQTVTQPIKKFDMLSRRANNTRLCFQYVDSFQDFLGVINILDQQAWFRKRAEETGKKVSYDWFCDPNNFLKIIEGNYQEDNSKNNKDREGMVWL